MIFWLWDAPGTTTSAHGISRDQAEARAAVTACIAAGHASVGTIQGATLVSNSDKQNPYYDRFGPSWQATRTANGEIRWRELTSQPAAQPAVAQG